MEATLTPEAPTDLRIVEGSNGMLIEVDGQILPNYDATIVPFEEGDVVTGKVVRIDKDEVLIDIGYKSEGVIPNNELSIRKSVDPSEEVELGEEVDALVLTKEDQDGRLILSKKRARFERAWRRIEGAAESGEPVTGSVIEVVKGGLIVDLGVRGFLPASLVDIRRVPNLDEYLGQNIETKVIELNRSRNNVVLSRRAVLEEERKEQRQAILERLQPGLVIEGQISNIVDFGAFVDLDGIDGLIHISELSWSHVNHPSEILSIGDTVQVKVLDIDRDRQRISLGLKQTQEDPWQRVVDTYNVGDELEGKVTKVVAFGAFVEILEGVEGLVHISELAQHHVENPREIIQPGDDVKVKILEIDSERRRLSLSIKRVEGQVLPQRDVMAAPEETPDGGAGDLDHVPELGLSEDVFAASPGDEPAAEAAVAPAEEPAPAAPDAAVEAPAAEATARRRPSTRPKRPLASPPFVGLTGGIGAGKSEALAALERLGASVLSTDAVVHELYAIGGGARPRGGALGGGGRAGGRAPTAPPSPSAPSPRPRTANGSRACCGRGSASASGPGARSRRRAIRRRARSSSRCRCCSSRGWTRPSTLPLQWWPTRPSGASGRGRGGTRRSTSAPRASSRRRRKRPGRRTRSQTPGRSRSWSRRSPGYLRSCSRGHEHTIRHDPSPPPRAPRSAAARCCAAWPGCSARVAVAAVAVAAIVAPGVDKAVKEIALPLRHEDIIRQQAADKGLDPALIAGVIYAESRFRDQTSHAGAKGLMQLLPSTADDIARKSGGTAFVQGDLADPQVNISYGSFYLRYLLKRYGGNVVLAVAAYNAGEGRVDQWIFAARHRRRGVRPRAPHPVPGDAALRPAGARDARALPRPLQAGARALSHGRGALVTGVSRSEGIGFAIARRLVADGFAVFTQGWEAHDAAQPWGAGEVPLREGLAGHLEADLADPDAPEAVLAAARIALGHVDVLVANHAASVGGTLEELTAASIDTALVVNVRASLLLVKAFAAGFEGDARPRGPASPRARAAARCRASCPTPRARRR